MKNVTSILTGLFFLCATATAQPAVVDSCFQSTPSNTSFNPSADLVSFDADLLEWTGTAWNGAWLNAMLTIPPPSGMTGCRAVFTGSGTGWTTGGEGFAMRLSQPLVAGQAYSFTFTCVSHGHSSDGHFSPGVHTNATGSLIGAVYVDTLPAAGYTWTAGTLTFTAQASQAGHAWLIIHTGATGSSGIVSSLCSDCSMITGLPAAGPETSFEAWPVPFHDVLHVTCGGIRGGTLTVWNAFGQAVYSLAPDDRPGQTLDVDASAWAAGVYVLEFEAAGRRAWKKVLKR